MSWKMRVLTAAVLATCIAAAPLVLAQCAAACLTHGGMAASVPSCHHAASNQFRIGSTPNPCSHDHHGPALGGPSAAPSAARTFDTTLAVVPAFAPRPDAGVARFVSHPAPSGSNPTPLTVTLPL